MKVGGSPAFHTLQQFAKKLRCTLIIIGGWPIFIHKHALLIPELYFTL